jgi:hypothetical protein
MSLLRNTCKICLPTTSRILRLRKWVIRSITGTHFGLFVTYCEIAVRAWDTFVAALFAV